MPYFSLRTAGGAPLEIAGNTEAEVRANIRKSGQVGCVALAEHWVRAFFVRRSHAIARQKAEQAGDEDGADAAYDLMAAALDDEEAAKDGYYAAVAAPPQPSPGAADTAAAANSSAPANPYGDVKVEQSSVDEDDFM